MRISAITHVRGVASAGPVSATQQILPVSLSAPLLICHLICICTCCPFPEMLYKGFKRFLYRSSLVIKSGLLPQFTKLYS